MKAEIISIGTELLLGEITDTNAVYISKLLALYGVNVYKRLTVGDNFERLEKMLEREYETIDIIITTGGLGPTADDLSKETACKYFDVPLEFHQDICDAIRQFFENTGRTMAECNKKQAYLPKGCTVMYNRNGTAPGFILKKENKTIIMLPGPPREMIPMFEEYVIPFLQKTSGKTIFTKNILTYGISESSLDERIRDIESFCPDVTYATYAGTGCVRVRLAASGVKEDCERSLDKAIKKTVDIIGKEYIYGIDVPDMQTALVHLLAQKGYTISTAESCTGGFISKMITDVSGAGKVIECGICSYSSRIKNAVLKVSEDTLSMHGAVSAETAKEMASGIRRIASSDIGVSVTGLAGPDGDEGKPVGLVYIGISSKLGTYAKEFNFCSGRKRSRSEIRILSANSALALAINEASRL